MNKAIYVLALIAIGTGLLCAKASMISSKTKLMDKEKIMLMEKIIQDAGGEIYEIN